MANEHDKLAKQIQGIASEVGRVTDDEVMEMAHEALNLILLRTKSGRDVEGQPFAPYSPEYAKDRAKAGYGNTPDLVRKGFMFGSVNPYLSAPGEATLAFDNDLEAKIGAAHDSGVDKDVSVKSHSRSVYVNSKGQRAGADEVRRDKRRKNKKLSARNEKVGDHSRHMRIPKREFFDVRMDDEVKQLTDHLAESIIGRVEKKPVK